MSSSREFDHLFKFQLVGDSASGKSALLSRWCDDNFSESFLMTISIGLKIKTIEIGDKKVKIQAHDISNSGFREKRINDFDFTSYDAVFLVIDTISAKSFTNAQAWLAKIEFDKAGRHKDQIVIVATKSDLVGEVTNEQLQEFAETQNLPLFITSSKRNINVHTLFEETTKMILKKRNIEIKEPAKANPQIKESVSVDQYKMTLQKFLSDEIATLQQEEKVRALKTGENSIITLEKIQSYEGILNVLATAKSMDQLKRLVVKTKINASKHRDQGGLGFIKLTWIRKTDDLTRLEKLFDAQQNLIVADHAVKKNIIR